MRISSNITWVLLRENISNVHPWTKYTCSKLMISDNDLSFTKSRKHIFIILNVIAKHEKVLHPEEGSI